jgi:glutamyl/glutaminyl-tRNA synthetase
MPTIAGLRRRGVTPEAIRHFCARIGVTKYNGLTDVALLEHSVREDLNKRALRVMAVLRPLKILLTNYPEGQVEEMEAVNNPEDPAAGSRKVPFSRVLYVERDDFMEVPAKKFFRLSPGNEVRLRYAYIIKCVNVVKDAVGEITELQCTIDPDSKSGGATAGRKIKGTIHWVSAAHAVDAEVRLYDPCSPSKRRMPTRKGAISKPSSTPTPSKRSRSPSWSPASPPRCPTSGISLSAWAISAPTRKTPAPANSCSTGRFLCAIPGRRNRGSSD